MDSADCRNNATTCIVMANRASNQREQSVLFELATSWMKQAGELESDSELSDAVKGVRTFARHQAVGPARGAANTAAQFPSLPILASWRGANPHRCSDPRGT
jgi:hypothetical protein